MKDVARNNGLMSTDEALAIVDAMFKWIYDSPIPYAPEDQKLRLSSIACIVIDACHADIRLQPLHGAYAECKKSRGIK